MLHFFQVLLSRVSMNDLILVADDELAIEVRSCHVKEGPGPKEKGDLKAQIPFKFLS